MPDWQVCSRHDDDGCIGIPIPATVFCLRHLEREDPEEFKAFFASLQPGASLNLQGTQLSSALLRRVLARLQTEETQGPTIGDARFDQAQFRSTDGFERARFKGLAGFSGATFTREAMFEGAQFNGFASFAQAQFDTDARFNRAQFIDSARFNEAKFGGLAGFLEVKFSRHAGFAMAQFSDSALFFEAEFHETAGFRRAQFEFGDFKRAQFSGKADFLQAQFNADAEFDRAQFIATTALGPCSARLLVFDGASFGASIVVEAATRRLSMVETRFEREATLWVRHAEVVLDRAAFAKPISRAFAETSFLPSSARNDQAPASQRPSAPQPQEPKPIQGPTPDKAALQQPDVAERPRLLSLRRVDAANLVVADLDLTWCLFRGSFNLDRLRIEGPKHFATSPKTWRWTERRTLAEEQQWRHNRHPDQGWTPPSQEVLDWITERSGQPVQQPDPDHVAPLYRALRKAEEDAKYEPGAADFYYGEMEMRRHADATPWIEKRLLWAYWLVSGYGLRGLRALISLLVVVLGLAALFQWVGFRGEPPAPWYWGNVLFAAKSTLSLPAQEQLTGWGEVLRILLRLTGPVLLGLALLSVRGRVKR